MQVSFHPELRFTDTIKKWQQEHIKMLKGPIDVFWFNRIVSRATPLLVKLSNTPIGYCIITKNKELSELFITRPHINEFSQVMASLIQQKLISSAIVSTRNPRLLSLCLDFNKSAKSIAYLFLDLHPDLQPQIKGLVFRLATQGDMPWIESDPECPKTLATDLAEGLIYILLDRETKLGYGKLTPTPLQALNRNIGGWVDPTHRAKGIGCEIILYLKKICYERSLIPTCGCDIENLASKRMLEKAGFYASDRMVLFEFC